MIFLAAWLARRAISRPKAIQPFRTVKISLQGRPMTFSGPLLTAMMAETEAYAA